MFNEKEIQVIMTKNESLKMMKMTDYCSTCHCEGARKHDCCNSVFRVEKNLDCHAHFRSLAMTGKKKAAFTLAETLITLTILGVVAAITVPMLINKQMEAANRTKLKKAMAAYEKALNQMIIDNDIKGSVKAWADTVENCGLTNPYFKFINGGNCRFQTADKVWWDITDIEHPVISLKDQLTDAMVSGVKSNSDDYKDDNTLFSMTGEITNGIVRINDLADSGLSDNAKANLDKIYAFMNKDGSTSTSTSGSEPEPELEPENNIIAERLTKSIDVSSPGPTQITIQSKSGCIWQDGDKSVVITNYIKKNYGKYVVTNKNIEMNFNESGTYTYEIVQPYEDINVNSGTNNFTVRCYNEEAYIPSNL